MSVTKFIRFTLLAVMIAGMAACNANPSLGAPVPAVTQPPSLSPTATEQPPTETPVPPSPTAVQGAGACANALSPVVNGATWTYVNTGAGVSPGGFSTTISSVRPDGFTVTTKFDDSMTADQQWACKPEGLVALSLGAGQTALGLSLQGMKADLSTSNPRGVTIPANVQPGMKWPYGLDIAGTLSQGSLSATIKGTVDTAFEAVGTDSVTVPAGTFNAVKVQSISTFKVTADYHGLGIPITSVVNTTFWFAPGVGWIKSAEAGELAGTPVNSTTELQSYHIP